ncbi:hypothetical protein H8356DRAFT_1732744 [Neocallimastix lanati (nom. inval.)]|nr:hypothetical protein H8356DRAFT_1732744 [Neocallimastix sp. JGI-2020a]
MSNLVEIFHKLECVPWEYIEIKNNEDSNDTNSKVTLTSVKQENDKNLSSIKNENNKKQEEDKKPMIIDALKELNKKKVNKRDSFQEKIKSIKTISSFSNSLNANNISNSIHNSNSNLNLTILPLTSLSQTIPTSLNNNINGISQQSTIPSYSRIKDNSITDNNNISNSNSQPLFLQQTNYYIKYFFNVDSTIYLFMITDMKNIWYEYIDSEELLNIKKKKNAVNFETQNNIIELLYNNMKSKEVNTTYRIIKKDPHNKNIDNHNLCVELSVPYMYVTFNWNFECTLLSIDTTFPIIKKENQDTVAKLDGSKIFYEHLTLPLTLMVSELHRRIERYEEVIAKKDKNIKILYDQLVLLEETPPKRFKFEEFDKKIFDKELRYSTDISQSEQKVFLQDDLVDLYKHVTNTILSKTFPHLINDEYKSEMNNERLSLIPTLVTESNEINNKDVINKNNAKISTINNDNLSSSLSYNSISDSMLQDDDNNQSILEELEKEKNKEIIKDLMKDKRNKIETIINKKKDKKKNRKRKLV